MSGSQRECGEYAISLVVRLRCCLVVWSEPRLTLDVSCPYIEAQD